MYQPQLSAGEPVLAKSLKVHLRDTDSIAASVIREQEGILTELELALTELETRLRPISISVPAPLNRKEPANPQTSLSPVLESVANNSQRIQGLINQVSIITAALQI